MRWCSRESNRESARRSRARKLEEMHRLEEQIAELQGRLSEKEAQLQALRKERAADRQELAELRAKGGAVAAEVRTDVLHHRILSLLPQICILSAARALASTLQAPRLACAMAGQLLMASLHNI